MLAACAAFAWMFRWQSESDPRRGEITYQWKWGRAREIRFDRNLDGRIDLIIGFRAEDTDFFEDVPPSELHVDQNYDGTFEIVVLRPGGVTSVSIDDDGDGREDRKLVGDAATAYWKALNLFPDNR
ncbi:MAG TPA: hypothetical protein VHW00_15280 [Thermoanaerobaculia bacterium]|nr:hypothetical protein [Thermoanaerobaculia bacterium]